MSIATSTVELPLKLDEEGATPEEIVQDYSSLGLADVYAVISYYLPNTATVNEYIKQRAELRATMRQQNETRFDQQGIRARLLAREANSKSRDAA